MDAGAKHNNEGVYFFNIPRMSSHIHIPDLCYKNWGEACVYGITLTSQYMAAVENNCVAWVMCHCSEAEITKVAEFMENDSMSSVSDGRTQRLATAQ